jgi:four helix bundle protein
MQKIFGYRDLEIWQSAMKLVVDCYRLCDHLPRSEDFGLKPQIRRAAVSIPANIAEGHGRSTTGEYIQHLGIAHGSLMELETHIQIASRLGYLTETQLHCVFERTPELGRMINALMSHLRVRRKTRGRTPIATEVEFPDR